MTTKLADILNADEQVDFDAIARRAEREEREQIEYLRICEQYQTGEPKFTAREVNSVIRAELERDLCRNCTGLPCTKSTFKHSVPNINNENGYITIRYGNCNYFRNKIQRNQQATAQAKSEVPMQYRGVNFKDYRIDENNITAIKRAQNFIGNHSFGIYYYGNCGCGKSMLAAIIANNVIDKMRVIYMDVPAILDKLRESLRDDNGNIDKVMAELSTVPLLIMDDIGAERTTEWTTERLYLIINNRVNNRLPTIYTSNYKLTDLYKHYGATIIAQRLTSRINATCTRIEIKGGDRRVKP